MNSLSVPPIVTLSKERRLCRAAPVLKCHWKLGSRLQLLFLSVVFFHHPPTVDFTVSVNTDIKADLLFPQAQMGYSRTGQCAQMGVQLPGIEVNGI